ncbi:MAG: hypothetical protein JXL80_14865 [Planctomycetes bacterium]|nr:hypothetical protein [Planctomycetota bacterium]
MSPSRKPVSQWKMMLIGRSSVVMKRVFVVILAMVSLTVWAITVLGLGLFRSDKTPKGLTATAQAAPNVVQTPVSQATLAATPAEPAAPVQQADLAAVRSEPTARIRNPFLADEEVFPIERPSENDVEVGAVMQVKAKAGPSPEELKEADKAARVLVLISTTIGESGARAVIDGKMCRVGDMVGLLEVAEIGRGQATLKFGERSYELRVPHLEGTLMGGKAPMAMIDGRGYRPGQRLVNPVAMAGGEVRPVTTSVVVKEIKAQSVILTVRGADFELGMGTDKELKRIEQRQSD